MGKNQKALKWLNVLVYITISLYKYYKYDKYYHVIKINNRFPIFMKIFYIIIIYHVY